nr:immunoglobulin heavy chain junction region [Mus musculus]
CARWVDGYYFDYW